MDKAKDLQVKPKTAAPAKRKRGKSLERNKARMGWLFVAPFLIGFALIYLPMIVDSVYFSFVKIEPVPGGGYNPLWVGWENYSYALFTNTDYVETLITGLKSLVLDIPAIVIFSLFMAIMLNQKMRGRAVFRAIFFIPVIVSTGIIESIDLQNTLASVQEGMSDLTTGGVGQTTNVGSNIIEAIDVERFFASMKIGTGLVNYVVDLVNRVYDIVNRSGVQMLIFLSGLQSISPAIYESAYMEGASSWETFWKITFPMISPMILVNTVYTVIDAFTTQSNTVMTLIKSVYNGADGQPHATAMSWMYFLIVFAILALVAGLLSAYVFYQRKD